MLRLSGVAESRSHADQAPCRGIAVAGLRSEYLQELRLRRRDLTKVNVPPQALQMIVLPALAESTDRLAQLMDLLAEILDFNIHPPVEDPGVLPRPQMR